MRTQIISDLRYSSVLFSKRGAISVVPKIYFTPPIRLFSDTLSAKERLETDKHSGLYKYDESEDKAVDIEEDVMDESPDVVLNQIELFNNWRNPHTKFVEETLKQLELESINQEIINTFCQDIENKTGEEIAHFFTKASVYYNDTEINRDKDPDLITLIDAVIKQAHSMSHDNLLISVQALNSWPEALRSMQLRYQVPSDLHHRIRLLYDCLRDESNKRLSGTRASPDVFISVASKGMAKAFRMADAWLPIDRMRRGWFKSFPVEVVHKLANKERGSVRRIKPMDKDLFVDFMRICFEIKTLPPLFHKYYMTVKFVDFLPIMNEDEIGAVCQAFTSCGLVGDPRHPMEIKLKTFILNFAKDNINTIKSINLNSIMRHISTAMPREFLPDILDLQKVMVDDGVMEKMDLRTLIRVAGMGIMGYKNVLFPRQQKGIYPPFMDELVISILSADKTCNNWETKAWHFKTISAMTAFHSDTPSAREACQKLQRNVLDCRDILLPLQIAQAMLHMAHLGLYDQEALNWLFSSDRISKVVGQERRLLEKIHYIEGGICTLGPVLMCLQGMVQMESPEYKGALITWDLDKSTKHFMNSHTPLQVYESGPSKLLSRHWIRKGLQLHRLLCELVGGELFVSESYVLPFTTQINYVILLDHLGRPREIPDWFRSLPETRTKAVEEGEGHWVMFTELEDAGQMLTGGGRIIDRLARRVGFTNITVDLGVLEELENTTQDKMVDYLRELLCSKCPNFDTCQHQTKFAVQP